MTAGPTQKGTPSAEISDDRRVVHILASENFGAKLAASTANLRPHVFLSFKTEERLAAIRLKDALILAGYGVWWQEDIQCGREWHGDIDTALSLAGCVVVLWSNASVRLSIAGKS